MLLINFFSFLFKFEFFGIDDEDGMWSGLYFVLWLPGILLLASVSISEKPRTEYHRGIGFIPSGFIAALSGRYQHFGTAFAFQIGKKSTNQKNILLADVRNSLRLFW